MPRITGYLSGLIAFQCSKIENEAILPPLNVFPKSNPNPNPNFFFLSSNSISLLKIYVKKESLHLLTYCFLAIKKTSPTFPPRDIFQLASCWNQ